MITTLMMTTLMMKTWTLISLTRKRRKAAGKAQQKAAAVKRSEACLCLPARGMQPSAGAHARLFVFQRALSLRFDTFDSVKKYVTVTTHDHNSNHSNHA